MTNEDEKPDPTKGSPWQDLKDAKDQATEAATAAAGTWRKVDDFATHSTSKVLGRMATITINGAAKVYRFLSGGEAKDSEHE